MRAKRDHLLVKASAYAARRLWGIQFIFLMIEFCLGISKNTENHVPNPRNTGIIYDTYVRGYKSFPNIK